MLQMGPLIQLVPSVVTSATGNPRKSGTNLHLTLQLVLTATSFVDGNGNALTTALIADEATVRYRIRLVYYK